MKWTEQLIGRVLARQVFQSKHLIIIPNCKWTGDEIDLLVVTPDLRIIDVEVKISRADLKADARKDKWLKPIPYDQYYYRRQCQRMGKPVPPRARLEYPRNVWKHYYALPESVWTPALTGGELPVNPASGIIVLRDTSPHAHIIRRAKPCRDAKSISPEDAVNLARLASLRMWDAYDELEKMRTANTVRRA